MNETTDQAKEEFQTSQSAAAVDSNWQTATLFYTDAI
jgi:hypothetical protein